LIVINPLHFTVQRTNKYTGFIFKDLNIAFKLKIGSSKSSFSDCGPLKWVLEIKPGLFEDTIR
jgi:hypothetical protein